MASHLTGAPRSLLFLGSSSVHYLVLAGGTISTASLHHNILSTAQRTPLFFSRESIMSSTGANASSPTSQAIALLALTSALVVSFTLHKSNKATIMPADEKASAGIGKPDLPNPRFVVGTFQNSRSQNLFTVNLPQKDASSPPKAMLFLVHGLGEHCCRTGYVSLYESLSEAGVDVYSHDHHGHGRSEGEPRGYCENFEDYVTDLLDYIKHCQTKYIDKDGTSPPLVLMGQSSKTSCSLSSHCAHSCKSLTLPVLLNSGGTDQCTSRSSFGQLSYCWAHSHKPCHGGGHEP